MMLTTTASISVGGHLDAYKDARPCVIMDIQLNEGLPTTVELAPITHGLEARNQGVQIPLQAARNLGLDNEQQFLKTSEANITACPTPFIKDSEESVYGRLPAGTYRQARNQYLEHAKTQSQDVDRRTDENATRSDLENWREELRKNQTDGLTASQRRADELSNRYRLFSPKPPKRCSSFRAPLTKDYNDWRQSVNPQKY